MREGEIDIILKMLKKKLDNLLTLYYNILMKGGEMMAQETKSIVVRVLPDFHKELKVYLASKGVTAQEYILSLIEKDMKENKNKDKGGKK